MSQKIEGPPFERAEDKRIELGGSDSAIDTPAGREKQECAGNKSRSRNIEYGRAWSKRQKPSKVLLDLAFRGQRP